MWLSTYIEMKSMLVMKHYLSLVKMNKTKINNLIEAKDLGVITYVNFMERVKTILNL
jgi:hypothetical protein